MWEPVLYLSQLWLCSDERDLQNKAQYIETKIMPEIFIVR